MLGRLIKSAFAVAALNAVPPALAQLWNEVIPTTYGPVQGFQYFNQSTLETYFNLTESNVTAFLGVPYAASTEYQNRWKAPQPREPWNETLQATSFGPGCPSYYYSYYSEDCLLVNIWTNAGSVNDALPVIVWNQGSDETSDDTRWYGGGFALKDVIFVSFNRRDDAFGFLALPELNAEGLATTGHNTSGNYGILDHLEVLKWVQANIANFGGDPNRITISGQSFGSAQTYHAINSPLFQGLFHGATIQSGIRYPYDPNLAGLACSYVTMDFAINSSEAYMAAHNVSTLAELRELSTDSLLVGSQDRVTNATYSWVTALTTMYPLIFKPVLDYYVIPEKYIDELSTGPASDVPVITGNARDESGASPTNNYTVEEYEYWDTVKYGNLSAEFFALYPDNGTQAGANDGWNHAAIDTSLVGTWAYGVGWQKTASSPFYTYLWDHAPPGQDQGAFHQSEIMYALNALYATANQFPFTDYDYYVADVMSTYWANFAKTGNPNTGDSGVEVATWEPMKGDALRVFRVGDAFEDMCVADEERKDFIMDWFHQQVPF